MQLTRAADYAIRVMLHLAGRPPGQRTSSLELAEAAECSSQFVAKVLQTLTKARLVQSHRGSTGGFELSPSGRHASVLEVVEAVEGPIRLNLCLTAPGACTRRNWRPVHEVWAEAQAAMKAVLSRAKIASLATESSPATAWIDHPRWN